MAQAIALVGRLAWRGAGSVLELFWLVRTFFDIFPVEVALTLGVIFFGLTWIRPRPIVALPVSGRRAPVLFWSGVVGSLAILAAATWTSWLATRNPLEGTGGWWQRPAPSQRPWFSPRHTRCVANHFRPPVSEPFRHAALGGNSRLAPFCGSPYSRPRYSL